MNVTLDFDTKQILKILDQLDIDEKIKIIKKLENETFEYRLKKLRNSIPKIKLMDEDIMKEIKSIRKK